MNKGWDGDNKYNGSCWLFITNKGNLIFINDYYSCINSPLSHKNSHATGYLWNHSAPISPSLTITVAPKCQPPSKPSSNIDPLPSSHQGKTSPHPSKQSLNSREFFPRVCLTRNHLSSVRSNRSRKMIWSAGNPIPSLFPQNHNKNYQKRLADQNLW